MTEYKLLINDGAPAESLPAHRFGGNKAIVVPVGSSMTLMVPPGDDGCLRNITYGAVVANSSGEDSYDAMKNYVEQIGSTYCVERGT